MSILPETEPTSATENSSTIPITESQIIPVMGELPPYPTAADPEEATPLRRRLAPFRRHLFAGAIVVGSLFGAAIFFATHGDDASLERASAAAAAAAATPPPAPAVTATAAPVAAQAVAPAPAAPAPRAKPRAKAPAKPVAGVKRPAR